MRALIQTIPGASVATVQALESILEELAAPASAELDEFQKALQRARSRARFGRSTAQCLMAVGFVDPELYLTSDGLSALRALARC